jgi:hypothetical protein
VKAVLRETIGHRAAAQVPRGNANRRQDNDDRADGGGKTRRSLA